MTDEIDAEPAQPVFHGSPARVTPPDSNEIRLNTKLAAGLAFGIGSAAIVAALLYARRAKAKATPPPPAEPSD